LFEKLSCLEDFEYQFRCYSSLCRSLKNPHFFRKPAKKGVTPLLGILYIGFITKNLVNHSIGCFFNLSYLNEFFNVAEGTIKTGITTT